VALRLKLTTRDRPDTPDHPLLQLLRQRVYQVAAGYEDFNDRHAERGVFA
jgi:hypothetical protein